MSKADSTLVPPLQTVDTIELVSVTGGNEAAEEIEKFHAQPVVGKPTDSWGYTPAQGGVPR
jgi:hypothetical protein